MRRHGDSYWHLHRAVVRDDEKLDHSTIRHWLQGSKAPRSVASMEALSRIERRYRLPAGYFKAKLPHQTRSTSGYVLDDIAPAERRRLAWHLPDDFNTRPRQEQEETGWLRQHPHLGSRLRPIEGLVTQADIDRACADWDDACDVYFKHASSRVKEIQRVARIHRDPFEPIMPVLEAESPVGEYRKITEEILRLMPDERLYRRPAAEAVRSFLMLRFGMHLGLRQKNLRQLMVCERGKLPRSERQLADMKRGEIRWSERDKGWEVLIPSVAFKNANSSYFGSKPFRLILPDLGGLYDHIEAYIDRHRRVLLGGAEDPGTFFIKTVKTTSRDASYDQNTFYEAWRLTIQRYGIYNPYTGRGAIPGLLPHAYASGQPRLLLRPGRPQRT